MAKIIVILLLAVVVVVALAACTQEETDYWDAILMGPVSSSPLAEPTPAPAPTRPTPPEDVKLPVLVCDWMGCQVVLK